MIKIAAKVSNQAGLHARPAAALVKLTNTFKSEIQLCYQDKCINAKSMISVLTCGIAADSEIVFAINGSDEEQAAQALNSFFTSTAEENPNA